MVGQLLQPFKSGWGSELLRLETEHGEGLVKGLLEASFAEIVSADEAI